MTVQRLTLAGWLAITYAVLAIPFFALSAALSSLYGDEVKIANLLLLLVIFALGIFPILWLKNLLNTRLSFRITDIFISLIIWLNVAQAVIYILGILSPLGQPFDEEIPFLTPAMLASLALTVPTAFVYIMFAIKLLRLQDPLHGMLKPFAYMIMAAGFCYGTIVLVPFGLLAELISYIILGIIFIRAAESSSGAAT